MALLGDVRENREPTAQVFMTIEFRIQVGQIADYVLRDALHSRML